MKLGSQHFRPFHAFPQTNPSRHVRCSPTIEFWKPVSHRNWQDGGRQRLSLLEDWLGRAGSLHPPLSGLDAKAINAGYAVTGCIVSIMCRR